MPSLNPSTPIETPLPEDLYAIAYCDTLPQEDNSWLLLVHFTLPKSMVEDDDNPLLGIEASQITIHDLFDNSAPALSISEVFPHPESPRDTLWIVLSQKRNFSKARTIFHLSITDTLFIDPNHDSASFVLGDDLGSVDPRTTSYAEESPDIHPIHINYLGRDFEAFRRQILERLSITLPDWQARSPADLGIMLVELLAHVADVHSYRQDAIATEAYLETALHRVSIRRHARLLDYHIGEGANARCWVQIKVTCEDAISLPPGTRLLTQSKRVEEPVIFEASQAFERLLMEGSRVFETMYECRLREDHNDMQIHTWNEEDFSLPKGTTSLTLRGTFPFLEKGSPLLIEQIKSPHTGRATDVDIRHRVVVRILEVQQLPFERYQQYLTQVTWYPEDALAFDLDIRKRSLGRLTVARANLVLADHGYTQIYQDLEPASGDLNWRPRLPQSDITHALPYDHRDAEGMAACKIFEPDTHHATPVIQLNERNPLGQSTGQTWQVQKDLLASQSWNRHFVLEIESDRSAMLRFGDGHQGWVPDQGNHLDVVFRSGNGSEGNIGAETIRHLALPANRADDAEHFEALYNPLPAVGGQDPEPLEHIRLAASTNFKVQARCITEQDYADRASSHPKVRSAVAFRTWTGSAFQVNIYVTRLGSDDYETAFCREIFEWVRPYQMIGDTIEINGPRLVPLEVRMEVQVLPDAGLNVIHAALMGTFGIGLNAHGEKAFFHPDHLNFGQPVLLSQLLGAMTQVKGVAQVTTHSFRRLDRTGNQSLDKGRIDIGPTEIAKVGNNPDAPELGSLIFIMSH